MNIKNITYRVDAYGGGGCGGGTPADQKTKFSASAVSPRIDEIIKYKDEIYTTLSELTSTVDSKVNNDQSDETVLGGAVGDIKEAWGAFQKEYNNFSTSMNNVKAALKKAGDSYDTFNRSLLALQAAEKSVVKPSAANNPTVTTYATK